MASQVSWLAFDAEQQRRTELMMLALAEQGTIDELGLGLIRDLVAGVLHPNLTVLHTRARYLVFIPRIYRGLTERKTDRLLDQGRKQEGKLIRDLLEHYRATPGNDHGIIGRRKGEDTKQLASMSYWPLLKTLGILQIGGSIADYCRHRADVLTAAHAKSLLHSDEEPEHHEDRAWIELPADEGRPISFDLAPDEAEWVRQRFIASERQQPGRESEDQRSVMSWLLDPARTFYVPDTPWVWDHPEAHAFPAETAKAMRVGYDVDRLVHGARILYNWLCANGRPKGDLRDELMDKYAVAMADWIDSIADVGPPTAARLNEIDRWTRQRLDEIHASQRGRFRWDQTFRFLRAWQQIVADAGDPRESRSAVQLVTAREAQLKPGRARLSDSALLTAWEGDSGYFQFDYNWSVARRMLNDIHRGLGTEAVSVEDFS